MNVTTRLVFATFLATTLAAAPAAAQGKGKGLGKRGVTSAAAQTQLPADNGLAVSGLGVRQFGSWLDDASLLSPGDAWTALSFGHYVSDGTRQTDFPVADVSYGLSPRLQVGVSVPYYRVNFGDGTNLGGVGDVYVTAKIGLVAPEGTRRWGVGVTPIVEVLDDPAPGASRFALGFPVNAEYRLGKYRVFGSTGFFTRGTVFASGAIEVPVNDKFMVTTAVATMRAMNTDALADALALPKSRSDINAVAAYFLNPSVALFGGAGRPLTNTGSVGSSFILTGGMSFSFAPRMRL